MYFCWRLLRLYSICSSLVGSFEIMNRIARSKEQSSFNKRFQLVQISISSFELSSLVCTAKRIKNNKYIFIRLIAGGIEMTIFRFDFQDLIVFLGNHQCQKRQPWMKQYSSVLQSIVINPTWYIIHKEEHEDTATSYSLPGLAFFRQEWFQYCDAYA